MSEVQQLYRLQEIDTEISQKKKRLGEVLRAQKETEELQLARKKAANAADEVQTWRVKQTDLNLELEALNSKAKRSEDRLYSGHVTNPKELTDLQNEIASLGRRRSALEDELLEAMIMIEEAEETKLAADETLSSIESSWTQSQASLKQEQNDLALRLRDLTEMRQNHTPLIPSNALANYESLRDRLGGQAVAVLRGNTCQGCQLTVSANTIKAVKEGQKVHCNICGRILTHAW